VSFYFQAAMPGTYPVSVQVWDAALVAADPIAADIVVNGNGEGWYELDLAGRKLAFSDSVRVGVFQVGDGPGLNLGVDTTAPAGQSYLYDAAVDPPAWTADPLSNYAIRATAHELAQLSCRGFLPPLSGTVTLRRRPVPCPSRPCCSTPRGRWSRTPC